MPTPNQVITNIPSDPNSPIEPQPQYPYRTARIGVKYLLHGDSTAHSSLKFALRRIEWSRKTYPGNQTEPTYASESGSRWLVLHYQMTVIPAPKGSSIRPDLGIQDFPYFEAYQDHRTCFASLRRSAWVEATGRLVDSSKPLPVGRMLSLFTIVAVPVESVPGEVYALDRKGKSLRYSVPPP